jgi:anti-sigma factor (TIGR02949 family)
MSHKHQGSCRYLLDSLSDFIDGELAEDICEDLEHHMSDCENCHIVVDTLKKTISLYQINAEDPQVPEDVKSRLFHCLDLDEYLQKE